MFFFTSQVVIAGFLPSTVVTGRVDDTSSFYCGLRNALPDVEGRNLPLHMPKQKFWLEVGWWMAEISGLL